jgi:hypothetical protein
MSSIPGQRQRLLPPNDRDDAGRVSGVASLAHESRYVPYPGAPSGRDLWATVPTSASLISALPQQYPGPSDGQRSAVTSEAHRSYMDFLPLPSRDRPYTHNTSSSAYLTFGAGLHPPVLILRWAMS